MSLAYHEKQSCLDYRPTVVDFTRPSQGLGTIHVVRMDKKGALVVYEDPG